MRFDCLLDLGTDFSVGNMLGLLQKGSRDSLLVELRTRDLTVASSNPGRSGFQLQSQLCVLTLSHCPFHLRVTAVACKRPRAFC